MIQVHPQFIAEYGTPVFVVLPIKEYEALLEIAENEALLQIYHEAVEKEKDAPTTPHAEVKKNLGIV